MCSTSCRRRTPSHAYDRIIGLDLSEVAIDGSLHKAPCGGEGTGPTPLTGQNSAGSGRSPPMPTASPSGGPSTAPTATTSSCSARPSTMSTADGPARDIETLHLDRGYDYPHIRGPSSTMPASTILNIQRRPEPGATRHEEAAAPARTALGGRGHQLVAQQLRTTAAQHRPPNPTPPRSTLPGRGPADHCETHRLAQPLEPGFTPYPLIPLGPAAE